MADEQKQTEKAAPEAPKYPRERLIAESVDFLGQPRHVVVGALHDVRGKELTVADAKEHVKRFLRREVVGTVDPDKEA